MADTRNAHFWRWYRTLPIVLMTAMLALTLVVDVLPTEMVRHVFFPVSYAERIDDAAARHGVDPHLVAAVIRCESGWNETAQSGAGAVGLMQLMPETAKNVAGLGLVDTNTYDPNRLTDAVTNIEYGTAYLAYLGSQFSDSDESICAYNAGIGAVQGWQQNAAGGEFRDAIAYPETREYLNSVNEAIRQYTKYYPNGMSVV